MIRVFNPDERSFDTNGDAVIRPLRAHVVKRDNAEFYLDLECGVEYADYLTSQRIVVAPTPQGDQAFRIFNPTRTPNKITCRAHHVFYDSKNYLIEDKRPTEATCAEALTILNSAATPGSPFLVSSDVDGERTLYVVRKSLCEAFFAVVEEWGGHLVRDNFKVSVKTTIGEDHGVVVRYGKNIRSISCVENWDDVVTQLLPVGKDGLLLPEKFIEAQDVTYQIPFCKTVTFQQNIEKFDGEEEEDYIQRLIVDLRNQAIEYIKVNQYPKVNYTLSATIDQITDVGDTIIVIDDRLGGGTIPTDVIGYEWDCILKKYVKIEFGNFRRDLSGLISEITKNVITTLNRQ